MRWQDKLSKEEREHLRTGGMTGTLKSFARERRWQLRVRPKRGITCPLCERIARKLGMK